MSIRTDLVAFLKADSPLAAIVSTRVYIIARPFAETSPDCVVVRCINSAEGHDLGGAGGWDDRTFVIECRSKNAIKAEQIADAVRKRCKGYSGAMGSGSTCMAMLIQDEQDGYDQPSDNSYEGHYVVMQTYLLKRVETL